MPRDYDSDWDYYDSMNPKPEHSDDYYWVEEMYEGY